MTTTTTVDTIVSANARHFVGHNAPSTVAEWLHTTTCEVIQLLDGRESFTIDQLQTLTRRTGASFLQLVLSPGQLWAAQVRQALTEFNAEGIGGNLAEALWGVLSEMAKRTPNEDTHRANMLLTEALQVIITNQVLDDAHCVSITSRLRDAIMVLNAA